MRLRDDGGLSCPLPGQRSAGRDPDLSTAIDDLVAAEILARADLVRGGFEPESRVRARIRVAEFLQRQGRLITAIHPPRTCWIRVGSPPWNRPRAPARRAGRRGLASCAANWSGQWSIQPSRSVAKAVWLQYDVIERRARRTDAGLSVVMDRCPAADWPRDWVRAA